ncbi:MAG: GTP pyrophosphokinase family protein [Bacteroidales bacterium]
MDKIFSRLDPAKASNIFEDIADSMHSDDLANTISTFLATENLYLAAAREIETKLENLNNEFRCTRDRNPIHHIRTRIKSPQSIIAKLHRRNLDLSVDSARNNLTDIAGIRVICPYISDIYMIAEMLTQQDDITMLRTNDYINNPKKNGYRSLHLIVTVPVFLSKGKEEVAAEVQIRTIAMDFWASLEHDIAYKLPEDKVVVIKDELKSCADVINETDQRMQKLHNLLAAHRKETR